MGIEYQKLGQPARAVDRLERAVKLAPANFDYRLELADAYLAGGEPARAESSFRALAAERPEDPKVLAGLVRGRLAISSDAYDALARVAPDSSYCLALAALSEVDKGDRAKAAGFYRRALSAQPPAPWLEAELDRLEHTAAGGGDSTGDGGHPLAQLFHRGDLEGVLARTAAAKAPEALYWRARAASELARASMTRMAALPPSAEGHELLGLAFRKARRWEDSLAEFREADSLAPGGTRLRGELAKAFWLSRRYEEAVKRLEPLIVAGPDRGEWEFEIGDSLFNLGRPEQALPHLRRAATLLPDDFAAQAMLGRILLQTGDDRGAVAVLERIAPHDRDGSIHFQLAAAYRNSGRTDLARQALARQKELEAAARSRAVPTSTAPAVLP